MIRFLHISDIHINKSFATKDEVLRHKLQRAVIRSFQNAIQYCIQNGLDALVIAGDLFDSGHVSLKDGEIVRDGFEQLNKHHIKVFYASGNHDYTHYDSKVRHLAYPSNVMTFFDDQPTMFELVTANQDVYKFVGCGHMVQHENRNLIENFPSGPYIGLAHSMVQSSLTVGDEGDYLPSTIETIASKGYSYFALGHIHQNGPIDKHETIYYSGSLQGLNSNETGLKGGNLVTIKEGVLDVTFVPLSSMTFDKVQVDVSGADNMEKLYEKIEKAIKNYELEHSLDTISLEITLVGRTKMFRNLSSASEVGDLKSLLLDYYDFFDLKIKSRTKTLHDPDDFMGKNSVLGEVLKTIDTMVQVPKLNYLSDESITDKLTEDLKDKVMDYFLEGYDEN